MNILEVKNLSAGYGSKSVIENVSFAVDNEKIVGILGANGCGKTTLLKAIAGILPSSGDCLINGSSSRLLKPKEFASIVGYVPQKSGISIDMSLMDVVLQGFNPRLGLLQPPTAAMRIKAAEALNTVGLGGMENQSFLAISEGQKQLCIMARTLCIDRKLLLLDEPESSLDFHFRYHIFSLLRTYISENGSAALVTLHDPLLALNVCDELIIVANSGILGIIKPRQDDKAYMEELLSKIYGDVCLAECYDHSGNRQLIMLKEGMA